MVDGVIFDLGGVVLNSPFEAIAEYEHELGIEPNTINRVIHRSGEHGAFARLERGEMTVEAFAAPFAVDCEAVEGAEKLDGTELMERIQGACTRRPLMFDALRELHEAPEVKTAALTNNFLASDGVFADAIKELHAVFDVVVESAVEKMRKPDPAIYRVACERLGVPPPRCIFIDDIGRNLKPAQAMGMRTIKCGLDDRSGARALSELAHLLGGDVGQRLQRLLRRARM